MKFKIFFFKTWICNTFDIFIYMIKNRKIIIRVTDAQLAMIIEESKRQQMNKSAVMRELIDKHIENDLSESIMEKYRVKKF